MEIRFLGKVLLWWRSGICAMWGILWANPAGSANSGSWAGVLGCSSLFSFCSTEFNLFLQRMFMPLPFPVFLRPIDLSLTFALSSSWLDMRQPCPSQRSQTPSPGSWTRLTLHRLSNFLKTAMQKSSRKRMKPWSTTR